MTSIAMSTDIQERDSVGRKRSHLEFLNAEACGISTFHNSEHVKTELSLSDSKYQFPEFI